MAQGGLIEGRQSSGGEASDPAELAETWRGEGRNPSGERAASHMMRAVAERGRRGADGHSGRTGDQVATVEQAMAVQVVGAKATSATKAAAAAAVTRAGAWAATT